MTQIGNRYPLREIAFHFYNDHDGPGWGLSTKILLPVAVRAAVSLVLFLVAPSVNQGQKQSPVAELLERFKSTAVFWQQMEVAKAIVAAKDISVLAKLQPWLTHEDRHLRGNAALSAPPLETLLDLTSLRPFSVTTPQDFPVKEFRAPGGLFKRRSAQTGTMLRTYLVT